MSRLMMLALLLSACADTAPDKDDTDPSDTDSETGPETDAPETDTTSATSIPPLPAPAEATEGRFTTVEACTDCHSAGTTSTAMQDASGRDISPAALWPATMMANAARDPIWRAVMEHETALRPEAAGVIENKCLTCHAPMMQRLDAGDGVSSRAEDLWAPGTRADLGREGVGCAVCHQIDAEGLGTEATFTGAFRLGPLGTMFGPHADPFTNPMAMHSGYTPVQADHITESRLCGSCHTVYTPTLDDVGAATGTEFHEQTTYLEWRNSAFSTEGTPGPEATSCQQCHVPATDEDGTDIATRIARRPDGDDFPPVPARDSYGRHIFVGANTLGLTLLRDHADDLQPRATSDAFTVQVERTRRFLQRSVHVALGAGSLDGARLQLPITVTHDAGHRFPSGFPSRRAWLEVTVRDAAGALVFRSGAWDDQGRLLDQDGAILPAEQAGGPVPTHVDVVDDDTTVAMWTYVMAGQDDQPTFSLLTGDHHWRDDRLLPRGWSDAHPDASDAPVAGVEGDADFLPGGDTVHLDIDVGTATGPFTVTARVAYQPLSARWRAELAAGGAPAAERLDAWLDAAGPVPEVVAEATGTQP